MMMSNSDWWANKMKSQNAQQPIAPQVPLAQPMPATYQLPTQPQYPPSVQVTPSAERCPGCGGVNYGKVGSVTGMNGTVPLMQCYECGWPVVQAGTGVGKGIISNGENGNGPARPARQVATGTFDGSTPRISADGGFR
jgi:hypothetical protein